MEHIAGLTLIKKNKEEVSADEVISDKKFIGFYFAQDFENCREFEPLLAKCYEEAKENALPLEIILVPGDDTEEKYFKHLNNNQADWFAVPFGSPAIKELERKFDAGYFPHIAVIKKDDGSLVSTGGTCCVKALNCLVLPRWCYEGSGSFCYQFESQASIKDGEGKEPIEIFSMENIAGLTLVRKNKEEVSIDEVLKDNDFILFYFSAHWCSPCRHFTPVLAQCYEEAKEKEFPLEIIFVSSDDSEEDFYKYMNESHGDWLAVPYGSPAIEQIIEKFNNEWMPAFQIVKKDGKVVPTESRVILEKKGFAAIEEWCTEFSNKSSDQVQD